MEIMIRAESPHDIAAIHALNVQVFGQPQEAHIVDALRAQGGVQLSLVAASGGRIVGHLLLSPAQIAGRWTGAALGPMAVAPDRQRQGIGSALVQASLDWLRSAGCPFVIVVGHPEYYPRFGFQPASRFGVSCPWAVPDEVFMLLPLDETQLAGVAGRAEFRSEFSDALEAG